MKSKKSRMPELGEAGFCVIYLAFAYIAACILLTRASGETIRLYGMMTLVLAAGDSFHLVPRILHAVRGDFAGYERFAGLGLLISSVTMTVFYLILYRILGLLAPDAIQILTSLRIPFYLLAAVRIVLCLFPQNNWLRKEGNPTWGILRNLPFAVMGLMVVVLSACAGLWGMAVAVLISFACYLPVVVLAKKNPKVGMLMIPKTMAYMWMIGFGLGLL